MRPGRLPQSTKLTAALLAAEAEADRKSQLRRRQPAEHGGHPDEPWQMQSEPHTELRLPLAHARVQDDQEVDQGCELHEIEEVERLAQELKELLGKEEGRRKEREERCRRVSSEQAEAKILEAERFCAGRDREYFHQK